MEQATRRRKIFYIKLRRTRVENARQSSINSRWSLQLQPLNPSRLIFLCPQLSMVAACLSPGPGLLKIHMSFPGLVILVLEAHDNKTKTSPLAPRIDSYCAGNRSLDVMTFKQDFSSSTHSRQLSALATLFPTQQLGDVHSPVSFVRPAEGFTHTPGTCGSWAKEGACVWRGSFVPPPQQ